MIRPSVLSLVSSLALVLAASASQAADQVSQDLDRTIQVAGRARGYRLHVPPTYDGKRPTPMVLVLHGGGGSIEGTERMTGFSELSDRKGFLLVYPEGTGMLPHHLLTWNSGNCCGFAMSHRVEDTEYIRALVASLSKEWRIDPRRVFATGLSNGGMMSYRLACEMSNVLAAVAPVAGSLSLPCEPKQPVSVIAFHGTADRNVLYGGGRPLQQVDRHPRVDRSVQEAISFWVRRDGCPAVADRVEKGSIVRETHSPCANNTAVELVTIRGGGHAWPGGNKWAPWAPEPTHEISATETMWEFFQNHPRR